jgi:sporulation protein YlmC with PRC-barrel domain
VSSIDEGLPIAYEVLEKGVPVYSSDGYQVGTVDHVVAAPEVDIFHGLVIQTPSGARFVEADQVVSLHEHGVDLRIGTAEVSALPEPAGGAPSWRVHEPGAKPSRWAHMLDRFSGADPKRRDWDKS